MASIVDIAKQGLGKIKYVFGGDNISQDISGYGDCSDYTQAVFKKATGVDIGGTTSTQYQQGKAVKKENLKAGDLVFFKDTYQSGYSQGVSHVGIYLGDSQFIHNSSGAGGVTISDLNSTYYQEHWLGARRVSGSGKGETSQSSSGSGGSSGGSGGSTDLKWWGDLMVLILTVLCGGVALLFFVVAFNSIGTPKPVVDGKKLVKKARKGVSKA